MPEGPAQKLRRDAGTGPVPPPLISPGWGSGIGRQPARALRASAGRLAPKPHVQGSLPVLSPVPAEADEGRAVLSSLGL